MPSQIPDIMAPPQDMEVQRALYPLLNRLSCPNIPPTGMIRQQTTNKKQEPFLEVVCCFSCVHCITSLGIDSGSPSSFLPYPLL